MADHYHEQEGQTSRGLCSDFIFDPSVIGATMYGIEKTSFVAVHISPFSVNAPEVKISDQTTSTPISYMKFTCMGYIPSPRVYDQTVDLEVPLLHFL